MKTAHVLNFIILLALLIFSCVVLEKLPEKVPMHYSMGGEPDYWEDKSLFSWFLLPLIAIGFNLFMYGLSFLIPRLSQKYPWMLNIPNKERFIRLPQEKKEPVFRLFKTVFYWICVPFNAFLISRLILL